MTCWIVYGLHFATNVVREIYPALAIGDHFSFRVDDYAHMHPDLFEKPGYGWHIGNNPGASMVAAIPYALARPVIDRVVRRVQQARGCQRPDRTPRIRLAVADGSRVLCRSLAARLRHQVRTWGVRDAGVLHGAQLRARCRSDVLRAAPVVWLRQNGAVAVAPLCVRHPRVLSDRISEPEHDARAHRLRRVRRDVESWRSAAVVNAHALYPGRACRWRRHCCSITPEWSCLWAYSFTGSRNVRVSLDCPMRSVMVAGT